MEASTMAPLSFKVVCSLRVPFSLPKPPFLKPFSFSLSSSSPVSLTTNLQLPTQFASLTASAFSGGGGDELVGNGGSSGGGGDASGGEAEAKSGVLDEEVAVQDAILLYVGGMTCGGCAASVKRILESQAQVLSATVYLEKETAVVLPVEEAKVEEDWQKQLGEKLASHLTTCGFNSRLQVLGE